jgi:hypothetical protein
VVILVCLLHTVVVLTLVPGSVDPALASRLNEASAEITVAPTGAAEGSAGETVVATSRGNADAPAFATHLAGFQVRIREDVNPYDVLGVYLQPGERLPLEVLHDSRTARFRVTAREGETSQVDERAWQWTAPAKAGLYPVTVAREDARERMTLNVFVMVPLGQLRDGALNGYGIGSYPEIPLRGLPVYLPPAGFVEVTPDNRKTPVAPHFLLEQFLCKQSGGPPRYVVLRELFLLKLEALLREVNARGHHCDSFHIMSGYRTPRYNSAIGNVRYSRHQYGDAADLFIDANPRDGVMDDLDGNGRIDLNDAGVLYDIIEKFDLDPANRVYLGGLGKYGSTASHGPFVHTDVRGFRARW